MPKISIVTTTYQHERFIAQALESILVQSFPDWELLVGDDASSDDTYKILKEYAKKDARIRVFHHSKNLGIVGNMSFLCSQVSSESEMVTFLEGDDLYAAENLQRKLHIFSRYPSVDLMFSNYQIINADSRVCKSPSRQFSPGVYKFSLEEFIKLGNPIQSFGVVAMRSALVKDMLPIVLPNGNTTGMFGPLDYWLWIQHLPNKKVYYEQKPLFLYRIHEDNFSKKISTMNVQLEQIYTYIMKQTGDLTVQHICLCFIKKNRVISAFSEKSRILVWRHGLDALKTHIDFTVLLLVCVSLLPWKWVSILVSLYKRYA